MLWITKQGSCKRVRVKWLNFGAKALLDVFLLPCFLFALPAWQHPLSTHTSQSSPHLGIFIDYYWFCFNVPFIYIKGRDRQDRWKGWERKETAGLMWWSLKWLPAVQKVERETLYIGELFTPRLYAKPSITRERARQCDSERKKRKWRTTHNCAIKQEQERGKAERGRERWLRRLPASPPFRPCFFPLASSSSSIILPRSIASWHKTELTSTALCNTAPPVPR